MAFQRSYSKVWWGSDNQLPTMTSGMSTGSSFTSGGYYYTTSLQQLQQQAHSSHYHQTYQHQQLQQQPQPFTGSGYHSLDYNSLRMFSGNLSRIQEVDDEQANMSKLSWEKHDSPGSLRSQDSGFSDNEESHSTRSLGGRCASKHTSPSAKSVKSHRSTNSNSSTAESPSTASTHTIATPPTVVRRVSRSVFYSPLVNVSRRISFSGSATTANSTIPASAEKSAELALKTDTDAITMEQSLEGTSLLQQLDSFNLLNSTPKQNVGIDDVDDADIGDSDDAAMDNMTVNDMASTSLAVKAKSKSKRRRRIVRTPTKPLMLPMKRRTMPKDCSDDDNDSDVPKAQPHTNEGNVAVAETANSNSYSSFDELEDEPELAELRQAKRTVPAYYNETIYLGANGFEAGKPYNNETVILGEVPVAVDAHNVTLKAEDATLASFEAQQQRTSTPKANRQTTQIKATTHITHRLPRTANFVNPLLNGHTPALQHWLHELHSTYEHEVMSTLQTKSIAQEAFKNLTITTNTVAKLIRQLQQRALYMQSDFERMERILTSRESTTAMPVALKSAAQLVAHITEFTGILERRAVFFSDSRTERKRYEDNLDQIKMITKDTLYSLERHHYINLESLLDDVQLLKRYLLIALRSVFERMVRIIVQSIEYGSCDLMLRANINMIATLTNIDYEGFASLTDAFVQNEAVRTLLIVCLEHKLSSVRALALRALATICCAPAAIVQLSACDGIEILRDILQVQAPPMTEPKSASSSSSSTSSTIRQSRRGSIKRGAVERREAVSLLTQLTAAWHGPEHRVDGLTNCVESIVAGLSQLVVDETSCSQTLLLCAAALNNLSRMEVTSHYSIMSNETIFKLIETVEVKRQQQAEKCESEQTGISIFLYEQIVSMLHNMSLNKKCHSHLANGCIINFITSAYEMEFYKRYDSRAESDAQRRTIKAILHTLTRLVHDAQGAGLGLELLQQQLQEQGIPAILFKLASTSSHGLHNVSNAGTFPATAAVGSNDQNVVGCHQLGRDIELLVRQLELAQKQQQAQQKQAESEESDCSSNALNEEGNAAKSVDDFEMSTKALASTLNSNEGFKFNLTKQESFV